MYRPVLVTAPSRLPITVDEVKLAIRADDDLSGEIESQIKAAVEHYEGWSGILGIALVQQTWRQDFDRFSQMLHLPIGPVRSIQSVKWRNADGEIATVASLNYSLQTDGGGRSFVRFKNGFSINGRLYQSGAVSIEYVSGWPIVEDKPTVPEDIKSAIKIRVQMHVDEAAKAGFDILDRVESGLVSKYRLPRI